MSQAPATRIFQAGNIPHYTIELPAAKKPDDEIAQSLLAFVKEKLELLEPDVVLVGLSTPSEGGVDEAVLCLAKCETYMLQDFWGDSNLFFGKHPDCYLVADKEAAAHTSRRQQRESIIVGSPRHACYGKLDIPELRNRTLSAYGLPRGQPLHGFFCQPLDKVPGFMETVQAWAVAIRSIGLKDVIYRPHPASGTAQKKEIVRQLSRSDLDVHVVSDCPVENAIVVCDSVSGIMSNSVVDVTHLNYFSAQPVATPIYLLIHEKMVKFLGSFYNVEHLPTVEQGLALKVNRVEQMKSVLEKSIDSAVKEQIWQNAKDLPSPVGSLELVKAMLNGKREKSMIENAVL